MHSPWMTISHVYLCRVNVCRAPSASAMHGQGQQDSCMWYDRLCTWQRTHSSAERCLDRRKLTVKAAMLCSVRRAAEAGPWAAGGLGLLGGGWLCRCLHSGLGRMGRDANLSRAGTRLVSTGWSLRCALGRLCCGLRDAHLLGKSCQSPANHVRKTSRHVRSADRMTRAAHKPRMLQV